MSTPPPSTRESVPWSDPSSEMVEGLCRAILEANDAWVGGLAVSRCTAARYAGVVFASDTRATALETLQETLGEGPGVAALTLQSPVLVPDLSRDAETRAWTAFVKEALDLGVTSVFACPVQVGAAGLGLLTLHATAPMTLHGAPLRDFLRLSDAVALALLAPETEANLTADGLADVLDDGHAVTHQAVGMVSVQLATTLESAMVALRARAFSEGVPLARVAKEIVARRISFGDGSDEARWDSALRDEVEDGRDDGHE